VHVRLAVGEDDDALALQELAQRRAQAGRAPHAGDALALLRQPLGQRADVAHQRLERALGVPRQRLAQAFGPVDPREARGDHGDQRGAAGEDEEREQQEVAGARLAIAEVAQVVYQPTELTFDCRSRGW
jgi:hypothetical protein